MFSVNDATQVSFLQRSREDGDATPVLPGGEGAWSRFHVRLEALVGSAGGGSRAGGRPPRRPAQGAAIDDLGPSLGAPRRGRGRRSRRSSGCPPRWRSASRRSRCAATALGFHLGDRGRAALEVEVEGRTQRAQTRALRARDRPGRDGAPAVDGGRVPRRGHRRPHRADRPLLDAAGRTDRHGPGLLRAARPRRAAARRRQGRDPRRDPAEARPAHAGGAGDRGDPRRGGPPARARLLLLDPRHGRDDRPQPPGEVGRQRLPARA